MKIGAIFVQSREEICRERVTALSPADGRLHKTYKSVINLPMQGRVKLTSPDCSSGIEVRVEIERRTDCLARFKDFVVDFGGKPRNTDPNRPISMSLRNFFACDVAVICWGNQARCLEFSCQLLSMDLSLKKNGLHFCKMVQLKTMTISCHLKIVRYRPRYR